LTHRLAQERLRLDDLTRGLSRGPRGSDERLVFGARRRPVRYTNRGSSEAEYDARRATHPFGGTSVRAARVLVTVHLQPQIAGDFHRRNDWRTGQSSRAALSLEIDRVLDEQRHFL